MFYRHRGEEAVKDLLEQVGNKTEAITAKQRMSQDRQIEELRTQIDQQMATLRTQWSDTQVRIGKSMDEINRDSHNFAKRVKDLEQQVALLAESRKLAFHWREAGWELVKESEVAW